MTLRVLHIITTLDRAGAELLLANTVAACDPNEVHGEVVCLAERGEVAALIEEAGWPVRSLGMEPGAVRRRDVAELRRIVRAADPDVVHTWMYHADLLGGVVAGVLERRPVVWSLHQTALPPGDIRRSTRAIARLNAALSWLLPRRVIATSQAALEFHAALGYRRSRMVLVPTAFSVTARADRRPPRLREELGIPSDAAIIGRVGRFHPQKDYPTLLAAGEEVLRQHPDAHLVLIGRDVVPENPELGLPEDPEIRARVHALGLRVDAAHLAADVDIAVSSSAFGESTPLVIGEAMAAGVPVVTTDVGDCAQLVGDTGRVVPPRDGAALAEAVLELLAMGPGERAAMGVAARRRIEERFSLPTMVQRYVAIYEEVRPGEKRSTWARRR